MYQLSNEQKRIWLSEQIYPDSTSYVIGGCLEIDRSIDFDKMNSVLNAIVSSNDCLRIRIKKDGEEVIQNICAFRERKFDFIDFSQDEDGQDKFEEWVDALFREPFIIEDHELFYLAIYKLPNNKSGVLVKLHHMITDGWTTGLISKEICERYEIGNFCVETKYSYLNYLDRTDKYYESKHYTKDCLFWDEVCSRIDEKNFYKSHLSVKGTRKVYKLNYDTSQGIKSVCNQFNISSNILLMCVLSVIVHKTCNQKNVVIGTAIYNRTNRLEKQTMGMFTNNIPVMFDIDPNTNFIDFLKESKMSYYSSLKHHQYSYDQIVKKAIQEKVGYDSIFRYCVNTYNAQYSTICNGNKVMIEEVYSGNQTHSLQIVLKEMTLDKYVMLVDYKDEYSKEEIDAIFHMINQIICQIVSSPQKKISEIELACDEFVKGRLRNSVTSVKNEANSIIEIIDKIASEQGNKVALEYNNKTITYRELIDAANQFSNYLQEINTIKGDRIVIKLRHNFNLFIAILGILNCGATYVPISTDCPDKRCEFILEDSECKTLICETDFVLNNPNIHIININKIDYSLYSKEYESTYKKTDLAYIIYTSGSSGTPKGVMIENEGLINYVMWANRSYLTKGDVMACYSSIAFDLTVTSIFIPLVSGNKIVIYEEADSDEFVLHRIINDRKCNIVKLTPSHIKALLSMKFENPILQKLIVGGEDFPVALCEKVSKSFAIHDIYNEYGPTEATVGCMIYRYDGDTCESVPIGKAIDNMKVYIMDIHGRILPKGMCGELCIAGIGVARGYVKQEALTNSKFIKNVYEPSEVIYKSGDIAKYIDDDVMVYCGRMDDQIKVNGHRIELSEVSNSLIQLEGILDSAVRVLDDGDSKRIVAYVTCNNLDMSEQNIKKSLKDVLVEYMIPSRIHVVDTIPTTTNGKIDFKSLDMITDNSIIVGELLDSDDVLEIVKKVLGVPDIYTDSNFYRLGGDSIKAIQISSKLRSKGFKLDVTKILNSSNISQMIEDVEHIRYESCMKNEQKYEILNTPIINWFFAENLEHKEKYFQYVCLRLCGEYDKFKEILEVIINHHDVFGYEFNEKGISKVNDDYRILDYVEIEWDVSVSEENIKETITKLNIEFDLQEGRLFKAITLKSKTDGARHLILCAHHLVIDSFSWKVVLSEIDTLYKNGLDATQLISTDSYLKWANHLHKMKQLESLVNDGEYDDAKNYPTDLLGVNKTMQPDGRINVIDRVIEKSTVERIMNNDMQKYGLTFEEFLEIAFGLALKDKSNVNDVVFEVENHGREYGNREVDVSASIGWYTRFLLKKMTFHGDSDSLNEIIKSSKEQLKQKNNYHFENSGFHFIRFNYLGNLDSILFESALFDEVFFGLNNESKHLSALCEINCYILNKRLVIECSYESNRYSIELMDEFMDRFIYYLKLLDEYMYEKDDYEFTPSDFNDTSITQADLDMLFI